MYGRIAFFLGLVAFYLLAGPPSRADRPIFRCESEGRVTYSDTACADAPTKTEVDARSLNVYLADPSAQHRKTAKPAVHRGESIAETQIRHKERCKDLANQIEAIETKLRSDNSLRNGSRSSRNDALEEKQRKLEKDRKTEKCH